LIPIRKEEFEKIFPELEKIYNHSQHRYKYWEQTVTKYYVIVDWKYQVRQYWKYNQSTPDLQKYNNKV
jgi:hypothetical protein